MKIVVASSRFYPLLGGTAVVASRIAKGMAEAGHEVTILTNTPADEGEGTPFHRGVEIVRCASLTQNLKFIRSSDLLVMVEMSMKWWVLSQISRTPHLVTHHTHPNLYGKKISFEIRLQRLMARFSRSTACSQMIARQWGPHVKVLPNPYDSEVFKNLGLARDIDFTFAGRFIPEKGLHVLLDALGELKKNGAQFRFAILGSGPEQATVEEKIRHLGLEAGLVHLGRTSEAEVSQYFNRSKHVIVPSLWKEPFGLIVIEAMACGAKTICSEQEGLQEASGGHGIFFETGNSSDLARILAKTLALDDSTSTRSPSLHLRNYQLDSVAKRIIELALEE